MKLWNYDVNFRVYFLVQRGQRILTVLSAYTLKIVLAFRQEHELYSQEWQSLVIIYFGNSPEKA